MAPKENSTSEKVPTFFFSLKINHKIVVTRQRELSVMIIIF